jgi:cytoskeletal protein RodZ
MKHCEHCGALLQDNDNFCDKCGKRASASELKPSNLPQIKNSSFNRYIILAVVLGLILVVGGIASIILFAQKPSPSKHAAETTPAPAAKKAPVKAKKAPEAPVGAEVGAALEPTATPAEKAAAEAAEVKETKEVKAEMAAALKKWAQTAPPPPAKKAIVP